MKRREFFQQTAGPAAANERGGGDAAKRLVEKYGYTAIKMSPHMPGSNARPVNYVTRMAGQRVRAVREAVGADRTTPRRARTC